MLERKIPRWLPWQRQCHQADAGKKRAERMQLAATLELQHPEINDIYHRPQMKLNHISGINSPLGKSSIKNQLGNLAWHLLCHFTLCYTSSAKKRTYPPQTSKVWYWTKITCSTSKFLCTTFLFNKKIIVAIANVLLYPTKGAKVTNITIIVSNIISRQQHCTDRNGRCLFLQLPYMHWAPFGAFVWLIKNCNTHPSKVFFQSQQQKKTKWYPAKSDLFWKKVKVKASHTRYRALGPELIPVYRQSARRWQ